MLTKRNKQVKPLPVPRSGIGRGFEHRVQHRSVVEKFFSKVFKISWFFRFRGHCILKNPNLSTGCYSIMGQNMGLTVLGESSVQTDSCKPASVPDAVLHEWTLPRAKKVSTGHFFMEVLQLPPPSSSHFSITKKEHHPNGWCSFLVAEAGLEF